MAWSLRRVPPSTQGPVPLRYTDRSVRDVPHWRSHTERWVWPDPNPMPAHMPRLLPRRRRGRR